MTTTGQNLLPLADTLTVGGFADGIVTISLLESWEMVFRQLGPQKRKVSKRLERRSAMILTGAARYGLDTRDTGQRDRVRPIVGQATEAQTPHFTDLPAGDRRRTRHDGGSSHANERPHPDEHRPAEPA
ncbi:MAG: hypothetical protein OXG35_01830 [Acidobacteria bacterium]|nr:hypothetical protein [Acidobacteriota bacterium]